MGCTLRSRFVVGTVSLFSLLGLSRTAVFAQASSRPISGSYYHAPSRTHVASSTGRSLSPACASVGDYYQAQAPAATPTGGYYIPSQAPAATPAGGYYYRPQVATATAPAASGYYMPSQGRISTAAGGYYYGSQAPAASTPSYYPNPVAPAPRRMGRTIFQRPSPPRPDSESDTYAYKS